jgi:hypothetical protein
MSELKSVDFMNASAKLRAPLGTLSGIRSIIRRMRLAGKLRFVLLALAGSTSVQGQSAAPALTLVGLDGEAKTLSLTELLALPQADVVVVEKYSSKTTFRGPTLRALMTLVGAPTGHTLRGPSMLLAVLADAADGYRVAYMLAELDQFGARHAILALTQNAQPLSASYGPFRIVLAGEEHHARWIRQVTRLRLIAVVP